MSEMNAEGAAPAKGKRRGLAGAVGLGAALSLAAAQQADAATELAQVAASDSRCVFGLDRAKGWAWVGRWVGLCGVQRRLRAVVVLQLVWCCSLLLTMPHGHTAPCLPFSQTQPGHHRPALPARTGLGGVQHAAAPAQPAGPHERDEL